MYLSCKDLIFLKYALWCLVFADELFVLTKTVYKLKDLYQEFAYHFFNNEAGKDRIVNSQKVSKIPLTMHNCEIKIAAFTLYSILNKNQCILFLNDLAWYKMHPLMAWNLCDGNFQRYITISWFIAGNIFLYVNKDHMGRG